MKYKKFKKKLALSKKTIANLNTVEMTLLNGGGKLPRPIDPITDTCFPCHQPVETIFSACTSYCNPTCLC